MSALVFVGTAGWSLPRAEQVRFPADGTHLERYAHLLRGAEINASFYRSLRPALYAKWAAAVPGDFRFSVKVPKSVTHERRLLDSEEPLAAFLDEVAALGDKLGPLLVQLPPSLEYDASLAGAFFEVLRALYDGPAALEPRHATWFSADAGAQMAEYRVARVAADPARVPAAAVPGGARDLAYFRLHGSPRVYWSRYDETWLTALASQVAEATRSAAQLWCIFDNTASGAALPNALELLERIAFALDAEVVSGQAAGPAARRSRS
ncbi:MAG TPA: DUF72 domain-containing protein [Gemmatimonadaceae bacterium]|nr:DUF72 domain-containing protein [Gemmatimonadaceae bacterium]